MCHGNLLYVYTLNSTLYTFSEDNVHIRMDNNLFHRILPTLIYKYTEATKLIGHLYSEKVLFDVKLLFKSIYVKIPNIVISISIRLKLSSYSNEAFKTHCIIYLILHAHTNPRLRYEIKFHVRVCDTFLNYIRNFGVTFGRPTQKIYESQIKLIY